MSSLSFLATAAHRLSSRASVLVLMLAVGPTPAGLAQDDLESLPRPDGEAADMRKPVQVYILLGQSNMLGFGKIQGGDGSLEHAVKEKGLYPYLVDDQGAWTTRQDVRNVRVMGSGTGGMRKFNNEFMTIKGKVGPEIGIGHHVGHATEAPVMILKSCIGNRSLGWDLLPPGSAQYEYEGKVYAGYKETPLSWDKGTVPEPIGWYAGMQYDGDVARAKQVLESLGEYYPGAKEYEVAGFFWWQGDKDRYNDAHAAKYEENLVRLIEQLRADFEAPEARFVIATLGQTQKGAQGNEGKILDAMFAVDGGSGKYKPFRGNVATVYSHPLSKGGASNGHYGGNAETYMNIGEAMGKAMARMILDGPGGGVPGVKADELDSSLGRIHQLLVDEKLNAARELLQPYLADTSGRDEQQVAHARTMNAHLTASVEWTLDALDGLWAKGDYCGLRDELARTKATLQGIPGYDEWQAKWADELATEEAVRELAVGDELAAIVARKERASMAAYHALLTAFQAAHPDSFYTGEADRELAPIRKALQGLLRRVGDLDDLGDMYTKYQVIDEARRTFAKIPEFDEAYARWKSWAKHADVKASIAAGEDYAEVFEDLEELNEKLAKAKAKDGKVTSPSKRTKAQERTAASHQKRLDSLADELEKLAERYEGSYYGRAARDSLKAYLASGRKALTDERER